MSDSASKTAPVRMFGSYRLVHSFMLCVGSMSSIMTQSTLMSFAIVCMTKSHSCQSEAANNSTFSSVHPELTDYSNSTEDTGEFDWDNDIKGRLLASSFYGLLCTQLLGGIIANKVGGGKLLVVVSTFLCGILTIISPFVVRYDVNLFFVLRLLVGAAFGLFTPSQMHLMAPWCVPAEQGLLVGVAYAGFGLASTVNNPISGFLCKHLGWPAIFYFNGSLALLWSVLAFFLVFNSPEQHPLISEAELNYIVSNRLQRTHSKKVPVPWKAILTSGPVWAVNLTAFFYFAGHMSILMYQPTYMREVLNFGVEENGALSSVSTICALIVHFLVGPFFDYVRGSRKFSVTVTRKVFNSFGLFFPALALVALSQLPSSYKYVSVVLFTCVLTGTEFAIGGGFMYAILDMAPRFSGVLEGIKTTIYHTPGFFMPLLISHITYTGTGQEWSYVMLMLAGIYTMGGFIFLIFSSSKLQSWAETDLSCSNPLELSGKETTPSETKKSPQDVV